MKNNYFIIGALVLLLFLSYKIISPYLIAIINAFILAYLIKPLYSLINKKFNKSISAIASILIMGITILLPAYFIIKKIATETNKIILNTDISQIISQLSSIKILENVDLVSIFNHGINYLLSSIGSIISYLPSMILSLIITLLGIFYILTNWEKLTAHLEKFLPVKNKKQKMKEIKEKTNAIIYGLLLIGIIEGLFSLVGFYLVGVDNYFIPAILIFFSALIPGVGAGLIWIPLAIYTLITGDMQTFIGIVIVGAITSYVIDLYLGTKILGNKAKVNPFVMFVGILGGISVFGIFGFIIGPLILVYTIELVEHFIKK